MQVETHVREIRRALRGLCSIQVHRHWRANN